MTQAMPPALPASIGPTSAGGTAKKSEPQDDFSDTFRGQLEGKVQEPSADSASTSIVQPGQDQVAEATQAASVMLARARGAAAAPELTQPFATSQGNIAIEPLADQALQGMFTQVTGVAEIVPAISGSPPASAVAAAVAAPTQIMRPARTVAGKSSGTASSLGVSGDGVNQISAVAPKVGQVGIVAVQSDVAADKGLSLRNIARPTESSIPAPTQVASPARAATGKSSGTASPIGASEDGVKQASAGALQSDVAADKELSLHNFARPTESSIPAPTQVAPPARAVAGKSSGTASPIGMRGDGVNQASAVAPAMSQVGAGAVQSDVAPDKGLSLHNFVRPTESPIPAPTQLAPAARAATGKSSGTASPIGMSGGDGVNQASDVASTVGQVGAGVVHSDVAPDKGLSLRNFAHPTEPSIPAPIQVAPPTRVATDKSSGAASPIGVSGDGVNQASAVASTVGQVGAGAVQSDVVPDNGLSLHNLARLTESSVPTLTQAAATVVPALAVTATGVHGNHQSPLSPPLPLAVDTPLANNPAWGSALAARLVWGATQGMQSVSIEVNPRDLGPVSVNLKVVGEETSITFVSQHALVREAVEAALPRLRELFSGEGLNLGEVDISSGEGRSNGDDDATSTDDMQSNRQAEAHADSAQASSSPEVRPHLLDSLVDTFV